MRSTATLQTIATLREIDGHYVKAIYHLECADQIRTKLKTLLPVRLYERVSQAARNAQRSAPTDGPSAA